MALSLPNSSRSPSTVSSFLGNLPELIGAMSHDPRKCLVVIAEFNNGRYLQLWVDHGNYIKLEVQSNQVRGEGPYLSMEEERRLRSVGFGKPSTYFGPNWWIINDWQKGFLDLFAKISVVVNDVWNERPEHVVWVKQFEALHNQDSDPSQGILSVDK